jgi:hypothetical protein
MKKLFLILLVTAFFACNNESTDTTRSDTTVIEKDNTVNRDTTTVNRDTMNLGDSANRNPQ